MKGPIALVLALALMLVTLGTQRIALAAAPSNDNFANATTLPLGAFTDRVSVAEATTEPGDPYYCVAPSNTVWYTFTAGSDAYFLTADAIGSDYEPVLNFYKASPEGLQPQTCVAVAGTTVYVGPGETWYIQVTGAPAGTTTTGGTTSTGTTSTGTTSTGTTSTGTTSTGTTGGSTGTTSTGTTSTGTTSTSGGTVAATTATIGDNLVFNSKIVVYVPIDIVVTVSQGSVDKTGYLVRLPGTVQCSRPVQLSIYVPSFTQTFAGRLVAVGSGNSDTVNCGPTAQAWTAIINGGPPVLFGPGQANAIVQTSVCDEQGCGFVEITTRVKLKRG